MVSREGSPLSSVGTAEESDHESIKHESRAQSPSASNLPPSKRRRTGCMMRLSPPPSPTASISSDTDGDVPNSPSMVGALGNSQDDDYTGQSTDQVTVCRWDGCPAGDLKNMDGLVQHLHFEHIGSRQKRYSCEWSDCSRKGQTHASAYALRAHMRSHTREKPFYCTLPECDRNFTRSDALTKHMRSVHEADTVRPSDPKSTSGGTASVAGTPVSKLQRIRLKLSQPKGEPGNGDSDHPPAPTISATVGSEVDPDDATMPEFGPDLDFSDHELAMHPHDLYRVLRRQIHWAEKESAQMRAEWDELRPQREHAWLEKEAIFEDLIHGELRLFSAFVGGPGSSSSTSNGTAPAPGSLASSLEKLQHQQQEFKHQQDQLQAKASDAAEVETAEASEAVAAA
ncbi:Zinc finger C2H2 [Penicillium cosmopolitanum]|uniref:Zinc finger C2H2 n=1 Tax=Penicillium cosmopolitanum TaxID=1131564 RepID=A0A9W9VEM7_9EURO|nr:Zinc finger C2H2 [Penicillium cosmopolitanum]KAJ5379197.1 Zinc finger C2H2 [Penicillium cosmopolitanum]